MTRYGRVSIRNRQHGIHPKILAETANELAYPLKLIFDCSFNTKQLPLEWKYANITPLYKQEAQLMLTTGSTRLAVSRGQQTWYHSTCYI